MGRGKGADYAGFKRVPPAGDGAEPSPRLWDGDRGRDRGKDRGRDRGRGRGGCAEPPARPFSGFSPLRGAGVSVIPAAKPLLGPRRFL